MSRLKSTIRVMSFALAAFSVGNSATAYAGNLSVLTWAGYELPVFHPKYLKEHPEGADITVFSDDNDALAKIRGGFHPDIAHPCTFKLEEWKKAGVLQPIDTSRIPGWNDIYPEFKTLPGVTDADGKVWMVPWDWGNTSIVYRTDLVKENTDSWNLLWDKTYSGRLATLDASDTPIVAAMIAGLDPFNMDKAQIDKVSDKLREQRPLLRFYTADQSSLQQALASGEIVAAMAWNATATQLKQSGAPIAYMKPKEGMLTWACGMVMLKDAKNVDKAYDYINARLDPDAASHLISDYGYGTAVKSAFSKFTPEQLAEKDLPADPAKALSSTTIMRTQKNSGEIMKAFEAVKAGG